MKVNKHPAGFQPVGHGFPLLEKGEDTYRMKSKVPEPTACPVCGAVYQKGRWQWVQASANAHSETCPACHRLNDKLPAGFVTLEGLFFESHRDEILRLVKHHELHEKAEHPLKRIMEVEKQEDSTLVTTTDIHLARGIGEAVHHAYQGELALHYNAGEQQLRVNWKR